MNNIVPADEDCLSQDQLSRYVQDECRLEEMRWIDRHLLNCPMCSDAVEGAMSSDMIDFQSVMSRVEAKIDTKVNTNWADLFFGNCLKMFGFLKSVNDIA